MPLSAWLRGSCSCLLYTSGRYSESGVHFLQYLQRLFVADAHKGIQAGAVGFAVRPFEYIGDLQFFGDSHDKMCIRDRPSTSLPNAR